MTKPTFVWDLDGTLIDSYPAIMRALESTYKHYGWDFDADRLYRYVLDYSVGQLLDTLAKEHDVDVQRLKAYYSADLKGRDKELVLFPESLPILEWTRQEGIQNFIYTHKGENTNTVLDLLEISDYFVESLHSQSGFARKPDPQAMDYLVAKYGLERVKTYYIGDRLLDMVFAQNSGVHSLNLTQPTQKGNTHISTLLAIKDLNFENE